MKLNKLLSVSLGMLIAVSICSCAAPPATSSNSTAKEFVAPEYDTSKHIISFADFPPYPNEIDLAMYKDPKTGKERWHAGFIDPYYNIAGYNSKIGKEYIRQISISEGANAIAFLRNVLMYLRKMIIDGLIFSEVDIIAKDFDSISKTICFVNSFFNIIKLFYTVITLQ